MVLLGIELKTIKKGTNTMLETIIAID